VRRPEPGPILILQGRSGYDSHDVRLIEQATPTDFEQTGVQDACVGWRWPDELRGRGWIVVDLPFGGRAAFRASVRHGALGAVRRLLPANTVEVEMSACICSRSQPVGSGLTL